MSSSGEKLFLKLHSTPYKTLRIITMTKIEIIKSDEPLFKFKFLCELKIKMSSKFLINVLKSHLQNYHG